MAGTAAVQVGEGLWHILQIEPRPALAAKRRDRRPENVRQNKKVDRQESKIEREDAERPAHVKGPEEVGAFFRAQENPCNEKPGQNEEQIDARLPDDGHLHDASGFAVVAEKVKGHDHQRRHRTDAVEGVDSVLRFGLGFLVHSIVGIRVARRADDGRVWKSAGTLARLSR